MATTITAHDPFSDAVITPLFVDGYETSRESHNVTHYLLNNAGVDIVKFTASPRSGTLRAAFLEEADAFDALGVLSSSGWENFELEVTERPALDMVFELGDGALTIELEDNTRGFWFLSIPFQEL